MNWRQYFVTLRNPLFIVGAIAATAVSFIAYFQWDEPVARFFYRQTDPSIPEWADLISNLGTIIRPEIAFLIWLVFRKRNPRWATAALFFVVAIAAAGLVNTSLKFVLGRCRPEMLFEEGAYGFRWFEIEVKYWSMPSGHTAASMAAMVALTLLFPRIGPLFLIQGALVGLSRVALMEHFVGDVVMGGVVGGGVALALFDGYFRQRLVLVNWWKSGRHGIFDDRDSGERTCPAPAPPNGQGGATDSPKRMGT